MNDNLTKARIEGAMFAAEFVLTHYEQHKTGETAFTPKPVDPDTWWSEMMLTPQPKFSTNSAEHLRKRIDRWIELITAELTNSNQDGV